MPGVRGDLESSLLLGADVVVAHQAGHPLLAVAQAQSLQLDMNPGAAVSLALGLVDGLDLNQKPAVLTHPRAFRTSPPGVTRSWRNISFYLLNRRIPRLGISGGLCRGKPPQGLQPVASSSDPERFP
jgi:hypothetical protein